MTVLGAQREHLDLPSGAMRAGMRLQCCEVLNWGTFHNRVWRLDLGGKNALLTGDIGSGKSTLCAVKFGEGFCLNNRPDASLVQG